MDVDSSLDITGFGLPIWMDGDFKLTGKSHGVGVVTKSQVVQYYYC